MHARASRSGLEIMTLSRFVILCIRGGYRASEITGYEVIIKRHGRSNWTQSDVNDTVLTGERGERNVAGCVFH